MNPAPDVIAALAAHLKADASVSALVGSRVFGGDLPRTENAQMPRAAIVLRYAGSIGQRGRLPLGSTRIDVRSYGATPYQSSQLHGAVLTALKQHLLRKTYGSTLLHSASMESGPLFLFEPDVEWPFQFSAWLVKAGEVAVT